MSNSTEFIQNKLIGKLEDLKSEQRIFCICCFGKNLHLINLANCQHTKVLQCFSKLKVGSLDINICNMCHGRLKKANEFILQVEQSLNYLSNELDKKPKAPSLIRSNIELNSTINSEPIKFEINEQVQDVPLEIEIETEIKVEHESYSDFEDDPPLSELKKEIKAKKPGKGSLQNKYKGKVKVVMLSMKEMEEERKKEALKTSYLNLPYKCESCITGFDHEKTLQDHNEKRHGEKKGGLVCKICKSVLSTKASFDEHNKRHLRRYECVACGKRYGNIYSVLKHYNEFHGTIVTHFACKLCDFTTESNRSYRYHRDKHRSAKVECQECGNKFVNKTALRVHMFTIHGQSRREYSCKECGKKYRAKSGLATHMSKHTHTQPAYCSVCRTHFRSQVGLRHHLKTNSRHVTENDMRFACDTCGSKFLTKSALLEHIDWQHLHNTQFACTKCSKVFRNRAGLKKHKEFVHEKKRPPRNKICDHCGRGFTTLSILMSHIRTHTGERPLRCGRCPATFAHSAALYTHNKLLHAHS